VDSTLQFIVWHLMKHDVFCLILVTYNIVLFNDNLSTSQSIWLQVIRVVINIGSRTWLKRTVVTLIKVKCQQISGGRIHPITHHEGIEGGEDL